jgi:hypothetical protein
MGVRAGSLKRTTRRRLGSSSTHVGNHVEGREAETAATATGRQEVGCENPPVLAQSGGLIRESAFAG